MPSTPNGSDARLGAVGVTRAFGPVVANAQVDLGVRRGTVHAIVGENGAGKTTLMRLLYGLDQPDSGSVVVDGRPVRLKGPADALARGIGIVQQELAVIPELTMLENLVLGAEPRRRTAGSLPATFVDWTAARSRGEELAGDTGVRIDWSAPAAKTPVSMRQQLEVLRLLYRRADALILDEPTSVLAPAQVADLLRLLRRLREDGTTILFISHKLDEVLAVADEITVMRGGRSVTTLPAAGVDRSELAELVVGAGGIPGGGTAGVPDGRRAASHEEEAAAPRQEPASGAEPVLGAEPALGVEELATDDDRGVRRLDGVTLRVAAGEIVGVAGVAGNGQDELVECVVGLRRALAGRVRVAGVDVSAAGVAGRRAAGLAYVSADRRAEGLAVERSLTDNVVAGFHRGGGPALARRGWLSPGRVARFVRTVLETSSVRYGRVADPVRTLSGGNQQRLVVGRELSHDPAILVAAQPTRGVDIKGIAALHARLRRLRAAGTAVLLVSEELDEVRALADRIVVLYRGRVIGEVPGGTDRAVLGRLMLGQRDGTAGPAQPDGPDHPDGPDDPAQPGSTASPGERR